jgi:hypothetical protein
LRVARGKDPGLRWRSETGVGRKTGARYCSKARTSSYDNPVILKNVFARFPGLSEDLIVTRARR